MATGNFVDPQKFPPDDRDSPKGGQNKKDTGYPKEWDKPHWHGDDMYNPHLVCYMNAPDGTRFYYDPTTGTHSCEYRSGEHMAHLQDGHIHTVPGRQIEFTGSGGKSTAIGGHHDMHVAGHSRRNVVGDTYTNIQGSHMQFTGGSHGSVVAGNQYHHVGKELKFAAGKTIGMGVDQGSDTHATMIGLTKGRGMFRSQHGDMYIMADKDNISVQAGKSHIIQADQDVTIHAKGSKVTIKSDGQVNITSSTVNVQGNLKVSGSVQAADIIAPTAHITDMKTTTGAIGSGQAPTLNNPSPGALDAGKVSYDA